MPPFVEVQIDISQLLRSTRPEIILDPARKRLARLTLQVEKQAREGAPRDTAALRRDIVSETKDLQGRVFFAREAVYYRVQEEGRRAGAPMPPPDALAGWASRHDIPTDRGTLFVLARAIGRRGFKGRFFMRKAGEFGNQQLPAMLRDLARDIGVAWGRGR